MSFAKNPQNINKTGRPKGSTKSALVRKAIQDRIDIEELFQEIEMLPTGVAVKHKIELLQFVLPRLKSVETPTKTLKEYIEEMDSHQIVNLLDSLLERLEEGLPPLKPWRLGQKTATDFVLVDYYKGCLNAP